MVSVDPSPNTSLGDFNASGRMELGQWGHVPLSVGQLQLLQTRRSSSFWLLFPTTVSMFSSVSQILSDYAFIWTFNGSGLTLIQSMRPPLQQSSGLMSYTMEGIFSSFLRQLNSTLKAALFHSSLLFRLTFAQPFDELLMSDPS